MHVQSDSFIAQVLYIQTVWDDDNGALVIISIALLRKTRRQRCCALSAGSFRSMTWHIVYSTCISEQTSGTAEWQGCDYSSLLMIGDCVSTCHHLHRVTFCTELYVRSSRVHVLYQSMVMRYTTWFPQWMVWILKPLLCAAVCITLATYSFSIIFLLLLINYSLQAQLLRIITSCTHARS